MIRGQWDCLLPLSPRSTKEDVVTRLLHCTAPYWAMIPTDAFGNTGKEVATLTVNDPAKVKPSVVVEIFLHLRKKLFPVSPLTVTTISPFFLHSRLSFTSTELEPISPVNNCQKLNKH